MSIPKRLAHEAFPKEGKVARNATDEDALQRKTKR